MTATKDVCSVVTHQTWCTEHREGDPGTPGYCTGAMTAVGDLVSVCLDQDEPGGMPRIYIDTRDFSATATSDTLSIEDSRRLRMVLERLERQATPVDGATLRTLHTVADASDCPVTQEGWDAIRTQADAHVMTMVLAEWVGRAANGDVQGLPPEEAENLVRVIHRLVQAARG